MKPKKHFKIFLLFLAVLYILLNVKSFSEHKYYKYKINKFITLEENIPEEDKIITDFHMILGYYEPIIDNDMNPIILIFLSIIGSFIMYISYLINYNTKRHLKAFLLSLVLFYFIANIIIYIQGAYYDYQLAQYDLEESLYSIQKSPEYEKAYKIVMNDTARNFAPFTLVPVSFAFSILYLIMYSIIVYISKIVKSTRAVNGRSS